MSDKKQTEKRELPQLSYDWNLLGNAQIAGQYLEQGEAGMPFARKSLELILKDANIQDPWIVRTVTDPEVLYKTIESQLRTYSQFKENQTVKEIINFYSGDIQKYLGNNTETAIKELSKFSDKKYSDILKEIEKLKYIIDGKKYGRSSEEEVEESKKAIEKYQNVARTFGILETLSSGRFRTRVEEEMTKDTLKIMYGTKEK